MPNSTESKPILTVNATNSIAKVIISAVKAMNSIAIGWIQLNIQCYAIQCILFITYICNSYNSGMKEYIMGQSSKPPCYSEQRKLGMTLSLANLVNRINSPNFNSSISYFALFTIGCMVDSPTTCFTIFIIWFTILNCLCGLQYVSGRQYE